METEKRTNIKRGRKPYQPEQVNHETRDIIIQIARRLFAEKGYDGCGVAEIAKQAGVNKALVFYYFGNKEGVLKEVLNFAANEAIERRNTFFKMGQPFTKELLNEYYREVLEAMQSKRQVIKILLSEALKDKDSNAFLFEFLEKAKGNMSQKFKEIGLQLKDQQKLETTQFFFDAMALFTFVALEEKWCAYKNFDREMVKKDFLDVFNSGYLDYFYHEYFKK